MHIIPAQQERLYQDVQFLSSVNPPRNFQNLASLEKVADYILQEFNKLDCQTEVQSYLAKDELYKNVIASFAPEKEQRIIVGAHYDVDGDQPGADDNASAVAGLLEIARLFDELKPELNYRYDFVAFSLEEAPFFYTDLMGSAIHAKSLKQQKVDVKFMLCLEMIGYFSQKPNSQNYPIAEMKQFYPTTADFIALVSKQGSEALLASIYNTMKETCKIDIQCLCAPVEIVTDITRSDHYNYWKNGYEALMVTDTSFLRNPNYHKKTDTIDTLDFDSMSDVVKGVYWALINA